MVDHAEAWRQARLVWPCGHVEPVNLTSLPVHLRERRATWMAATGVCMACFDASQLGVPALPPSALRPVRPAGEPRLAPGVPVITRMDHAEEILGSAPPAVEVDSTRLVRVETSAPTVVSVAPDSSGLIGPTRVPVRVWGRTRVARGGTAVCAPGAAVWLLGGCAAVGDQARVIASSGRAIAGPGAQVSVQSSDAGLEVWVLPGCLVAGPHLDMTLLSAPALVRDRAVEPVAVGDVPADLLDLLALAESLPVRRQR